MIRLIFPGKCISKDNDKSYNPKSGFFFLAPKHRAYQNMIALQAKIQMKYPPLEGPLSVEIIFYMPNKVRGDLFNLPKSICDALTGIVWLDDKQIESGTLCIKYDKKNPRAEMTVYRLSI